MKNRFRMTAPLALNLLIVLPLCAYSVETDDSTNREQVIQEFDIAKNGDHPVIPVTIAGKQFGFVLDCGSTRSVFDQSLRNYVGRFLRMEEWVAPSGQHLKMDLFECPAGSVGKVPLSEGMSVALSDLGWMRRYTGQKIYGFLGMDFLATRVVRINFDEGKVTFFRKIGDDAGQEIPLFLSDDWKMPYVENVISGWKSERFQIDTGLDGGNGRVRSEFFLLWPNKAGFIRRGVPDISISAAREVQPAVDWIRSRLENLRSKDYFSRRERVMY